ncbi:MAG: DNA/RNA nuclease SfsA [Chloroflexota bacterium]
MKPYILLDQPQRHGRFLRRLNRFAVEIELDEGAVAAHLPNSGRMNELLVAGHPVVLAERHGIARKTAFDMQLVQYGSRWVSVDSRIPNALAAEAIRRREVTWGDSRFDLELREGNRRCLVETKSVNLVENGRALFPDAPTTRGARHVRTLIEAVRSGLEAGVLFVIQRDDARVLSPFDAADPEFGRALREAAAAGVVIEAYRCRVTPDRMTLDERVPVEL